MSTKRSAVLLLLLLLLGAILTLPQSLNAAEYDGQAVFEAALNAPPAAGDDTPTRLNKKIKAPSEGKEYLVKRDEYFISRRIAGDNPLSIEEAAEFRFRAAQVAANLKKTSPARLPEAFGGAWTAIGPNPIVQVSRSNHFYAVSGRIGALAMRSDGRRILGGAQGGIWIWNSGTSVWEPKTDNLPSLAIGALALAPSNEDIVYAGTGEGHLSGDSYFGNGVLKSTDGGMTWSHVSGTSFRGVAFARIVVHPTNPDRLWAAVIRGRGGARRVSPPNPTLYGIWESQDGGVNWTLRMGGPNLTDGGTDLVIDPQSPNKLYASFWGNVVTKSTDFGMTWAPVMNGFPANADWAAEMTRFALSLSHPSGQSPVLYAGFDYADTGGGYHKSRVWKSTDEGANWNILPAGSGADTVEDYCGGQCWYDNFIAADPTNPDVVFAGGQFNYSIGSGGLFRSDDGGNTWRNLGYDQHPDFQAFAFNPSTTANVIVGSDGGVWYSSDRGGRPNASDPLSAVTWVNLNGTVNATSGAVSAQTNLQISQFTSIATNPTLVERYWGGTQDNGTPRKTTSSTRPTRWFDVASGDGGQVLVDPTDFNYVYGTYYGITPYRFTDGGLFFFSNEYIRTGINLSDRAEFYIPMAMNRWNPNQLFLGTYRLYRTDNAKATKSSDVMWRPISGDLTLGCPGTAPNGARGCLISAIGLSMGGNGVWVGSDDGLVHFAPDGTTSNWPSWVNVTKVPLPRRPVTQIAVDRSNDRVAYVAYASFNGATPRFPGHLFRTTDGGQTWRDVSGNLPDAPVNSVIIDPSYPRTLYVGTDVGPFVTTDGGAHWNALGTGFPIVAIWQLDLDAANRNLAAGTHGRGAWKLSDATTTVPALVIKKSDDGIPVGPDTNLRFTLTVRNIGNADATGVEITDAVPENTTFVSATNAGVHSHGKVMWSGLTVPKGGNVSVKFTVRINRNASRLIVNNDYVVKSAEGVGARGSPYVVNLAAPNAVSLAPTMQIDGTRPGQSLTYNLAVRNLGYRADKYKLNTSGNMFPTTFYDAPCTNMITQTANVMPGATVNICVKVDVPAAAARGAKGKASGAPDIANIKATSLADPKVRANATINTIAVTTDILLVDNDNNNPDVKSYYQNALNAYGQAYDFWDLKVDPNLPLNYLKAHKKVVWFTGASYPGPILPYESKLASFLDNGGRLFMSGWDILDQAAGTTSFVHDYLHIDWDGSEAQNDIPTANVTSEAGNAVTDGIGTVALNLAVLGGVQYSDQLTLVSPAAVAFRDDAAEPDGLSVDTGTYKLVFLAFPLEEFGSQAQKDDLMSRVLNWLGP